MIATQAPRLFSYNITIGSRCQSVHIRDTYLLSVAPPSRPFVGGLYSPPHSNVVPCRVHALVVRSLAAHSLRPSVRLIQRTTVRYVRCGSSTAPARRARRPTGRAGSGSGVPCRAVELIAGTTHTKTRCRWQLQRTSVHLHGRTTGPTDHRHSDAKAFSGHATPVYLMSWLLDR